jgi:DNA-binding response OmpR family regulator
MTLGADSEPLAITHYRAGSDLALPGSVSLPLLAAGVQTLADRAREGDSPLMRVGQIILDAEGRKVRVGDRPVKLSRLEFDLLLCLAKSATKTLTKAELAREVWGNEVMARSSRTVDSHISRVRRKLNDAGADQALQAVRGVGYRLER